MGNRSLVLSVPSSATAPNAAFMHRFVAEQFPWACALWLHLALFAVLTSPSLQRVSPPRLPDPVQVEILPAPRSATRPQPAPPAASAGERLAREKTAPATPAAGPEREPRTWITARTFLAADVLKDPRSRQARLALASLTGADNREQICALEAMEQLRRDNIGFRPTRLAPHAFRNAFFRKDMIHVTAGAVRSNRIWYEIAYRCRLNTGSETIVGFEYALGAPVDRALWDEHGLAPIH